MSNQFSMAPGRQQGCEHFVSTGSRGHCDTFRERVAVPVSRSSKLVNFPFARRFRDRGIAVGERCRIVGLVGALGANISAIYLPIWEALGH